MFLLYQTIAIIVIIHFRISILQLFGLDLLNPKKNIVNFLVDLKRWDQIFRLLQFLTIFLAGYFELVPTKFAEYGYFVTIARISQLNQFTKIVFNFRRIVRVLRVPSISKYLMNNWKNSQFKLNQSKFLESSIILTDIMANLCFVTLFIIDAVALIFQFGFCDDLELQEYFDICSQGFWMIASVFCIISNGLKLFQMQKYKICDVKNPLQPKKRQTHFTYAQIIRCILDITAAYAFLNHQFMFKRTLGSIGIVSSVLLMADFFK